MIKLKSLILLTAIEGLAAVNAPAAADQNEPNGLTSLTEKSKQIRGSVLRTHITSLPGGSSGMEKAALEKRILQLSGMKVPHLHSLQKAPATIEAATVEPNVALPQPIKTSTDLFDEKTLLSLVSLAGDPNSVAEPLALAQTLYDAGHPKEAASFYKIALSRTASLGRILTKDDKAWILLQLASCHSDDISAALLALNRLLAEYPKSMWATVAAAKRDVLQWYQKDKPRSLLESR